MPNKVINKILIIDDEKTNLQVLGSILRDSNYRVMAATTGKVALSTAKTFLPDIILLDIMMPEVDGYEVCKQLKNDPITYNIPVLFLSAKNDLKDRLKGLNAGAVDYMLKPFEKDEVLKRIEIHIKLRKAHQEILNLNNELTTTNEKLANYNKILEEKNITLDLLYNQISKQAERIWDSINYAGTVIEAILPSESTLIKLFKNHFLIFKPKDIVGGDFYWVKKIDNFIYLTVADCTGHGVPGALLSVLGIAYLNELLLNKKDDSPSNILTKLGNNFKTSFLNTKDDQRIFDMDIALCKINFKEYQLEFSGIHIPLYILRMGKLQKIESNRFTLQQNVSKNLPLNQNFIELKKGDIIYLITDGFIDQFSDKEHKKIGRKKFEKLLLENQDKSLIEQKKHLSCFFENWKGKTDQLDDICIFCFKVP